MGFEPMTTPGAASSPSVLPQPVAAPLTRAAIFLVLALNPGDDNRTSVGSFCADLAALVRAVGFRAAEGNLSCIMAFGSDAWDRLFGLPRPAELHQFREIRAEARHAVATPGDLFFHIRAERMDLCFELATQIMTRLGGAVSPGDEVEVAAVLAAASAHHLAVVPRGGGTKLEWGAPPARCDVILSTSRIEGIVGAITGILLVVAVYLMVTKPGA